MTQQHAKLTDTTGVAPHIRGGDVRDGRVRVIRLANILISTRDVTIDDESLEVVMSEDDREEGCSGQEAGGGVHDVSRENVNVKATVDRFGKERMLGRVRPPGIKE